MTLRLSLGIDPGQTGAIAAIADGQFAGVIDMPVVARKAGGFHVDDAQLAVLLRELSAPHQGAYINAALEMVSARPKQNVSAMFRFGESYGIVKGVLGTMRIPRIEVHPAKWKNYVGLRSKEKDAGRQLAISLFPAAASQLKRKKDIGRAEALLIAYWNFQKNT